jgi:hypothetical protein
MKHNMRRTSLAWKLPMLVFASALTLVGCADVPPESDSQQSNLLGQDVVRVIKTSKRLELGEFSEVLEVTNKTQEIIRVYFNGCNRCGVNTPTGSAEALLYPGAKVRFIRDENYGSGSAQYGINVRTLHDDIGRLGSSCAIENGNGPLQPGTWAVGREGVVTVGGPELGTICRSDS